MGGIFGVVATGASAEPLNAQLFRLSESCGKEASEMAGIAGDTIRVLNSPVPSNQLR